MMSFSSVTVELVPISKIRVGERLRPAGNVSALAESISRLGLLNPILLSSDLRLIAGLHRIEACKLNGWAEIPARIYPASEMESTLVEIDENLIRSELSVLEQAEQYDLRKSIYDLLYPETRRGGRRGNQHLGGVKRQSNKVTFTVDAAQKTGQSARTIQRLIRIARHLTPETKELIRRSRFADNRLQLLKLSRLAPEVQVLVARKLAEGDAETVKQAHYRVQREELLSRPCTLPLEGTDYRILLGDFRKVGSRIPAESCHLLLSDPPYSKNDLGLFDSLGELASRILVPGGSLVLMIGHYFLPEIIAALGKHLRYQWLLSCVMNGEAKFIDARRVTVAFKPVVWFVKGHYSGKTVRDVVKSGGSDKRFHDWGQSEVEFGSMVESFSEPGQTVVDPFIGGGTTGIAALRLGRRFVGIDKNATCVELSRRRFAARLVPTIPDSAPSFLCSQPTS